MMPKLYNKKKRIRCGFFLKLTYVFYIYFVNITEINLKKND